MMIRALRQIGYTFEQAIADLVDNSVSAGATSILIRFIAQGERIRSIAIVDDGAGMSAARLGEAMRFGSETDVSRRTLGKYGMGMKLASLSHAQILTVVSAGDGRLSGRRWSLDGIGRGWACEELSDAGIGELADAAWAGIDFSRHGTLVLWDEIDRLPTGSKGLRESLKALHRRLQIHIGMTFHRFLEEQGTGKRLRILVDLQQDGAREQAHRVPIRPLDPFGYEQSGHPEYPKTYRVEIEPGVTFDALATIWPPNSDDERYKLGNRAAARQGFYFYRNERLIQAGGWNGLVQADAEPHGSLARVRIDLPEALDAAFGLNVQKSAVVVPPNFVPAVLSARASDGTTFEEFRRAAQLVYRRQDARAERAQPIVPGVGVPVAVRRLIRKTLNPDAAGRTADFRWATFEDESRVFEIDRGSRQILLNRRLRELQGSTGSPAELRLLKVCLFLILQEDLGHERVTTARQQRVDLINAALGRTLSL